MRACDGTITEIWLIPFIRSVVVAVSPLVCTRFEVRCLSANEEEGEICVPEARRCDGKKDCLEGQDELDTYCAKGWE